jgi:hypothetical protein
VPSLVHDLQNDIRRSGKSVTEILRTAKLISAKLGLREISEWIDAELNGYIADNAPEYRTIRGGSLYVFKPNQGWQFAGDVGNWARRTGQSISELEEMATGETVSSVPNPRFPLKSIGPVFFDSSALPQKVEFSSLQIKQILEAVKNKLLDWAIELEQRGILGENMSFDPEEKQSAKSQTFHIQNATGVFGAVSNSQVTIYDYSSIHHTLKQAGVPQEARNEIENIMDSLKTAKPEEKTSLVERGKSWILKNEEFLGASASIVRKAFGFE